MRVLMLSKALVVGAYQRKCEELATLPNMHLRVVVPPYWREGPQVMTLERRYTNGYELVSRQMALNGHFHVHFYPGLGRDFRQFRPEIAHIDEEAYNVATAHGMWLSKRAGAKTVFFTWQNIYRDFPFPFSVVERYCLSRADYAIAGNEAAREILTRKGFRRPVSVIPQFGVDESLYDRDRVAPTPNAEILKARQSGQMVIGYAGRLIRGKGVHVLIEALSGLRGEWRLVLLGDGDYKQALADSAAAAGIADRIIWQRPVSSVDVPSYLSAFDVLVLPSLTTTSWKEQFGRVLIEAMACRVSVVGSDSGEIPFVIGDAGLVFPEGNAMALRECLDRLMRSPGLRDSLGEKGRTRVLETYTQRSIAQATHRVYEEMLSH